MRSRTVTRMLIVVLTAVGLLALPVGTQVASAAADCGSLPGRIHTLNTDAQSYKTRVDTHNEAVQALNSQRSAVDTRNAAAVSAWNARRQQLLTQETDLRTEGAAGQRRASALRTEARECGTTDSIDGFTPPSNMGSGAPPSGTGSKPPSGARSTPPPAAPKETTPKATPKSPENHGRSYPEPPKDWKPTWSNGKPGNPRNNAIGHFDKHGKEFPGIKTPQQYVDAATKFFKNPPPGTRRLVRNNGDVLLYDPATNTFLTADRAGNIKTMFKPATHMDYWLNQVAKNPGSVPEQIRGDIDDVLGE